MDNFMDKLAQRLTAQEMIKANSAADAAELERLQKQLAQYDACLQEMRKLSLNNTETSDKLAQTSEQIAQTSEQIVQTGCRIAETNSRISETGDRIFDINERMSVTNEKIAETVYKINDLVDESISKIKEIESGPSDIFDGLDEKANEYIDKINDYVHKENVKVYRNVQAVVVEELNKHAEAQAAEQKKTVGKIKTTFILSIVTLGVLVADIALSLLMYYQVF